MSEPSQIKEIADTSTHPKQITQQKKLELPAPKPLKERMWEFYSTQYKALIIIPVLLLLFCIGVIGHSVATTGDIFPKDVSLKGGATITVPLDIQVEASSIEHSLQSALPQFEVAARNFGLPGSSQGIIVSADVNINNQAELDSLLAAISTALGHPLKEGEYGIEIFGSSLGESFFQESAKIILVAFFLMALVIFGYFRTFVPSLAIILAAVGDMLAAIAFVNIFDIPLGTAGIAALLMLIGYSVDTDILLTIRVLKRKEGSVDDRIASSIKTGLTQTFAAILTMAIGYSLAQSEVIRQIMLVLMVGLTADLVFTWILNVGMLRYYLHKKNQVTNQ
jgi:preprotein translocase subunit SecF